MLAVTDTVWIMQAMNQGLEAAINNYASNALSLAAEPASRLGINNTYLDFIALTSPYDVLDGITRLADYSIGKVCHALSLCFC